MFYDGLALDPSLAAHGMLSYPFTDNEVGSSTCLYEIHSIRESGLCDVPNLRGHFFFPTRQVRRNKAIVRSLLRHRFLYRDRMPLSHAPLSWAGLGRVAARLVLYRAHSTVAHSALCRDTSNLMF